jgi:hypothetical protein
MKNGPWKTLLGTLCVAALAAIALLNTGSGGEGKCKSDGDCPDNMFCPGADQQCETLTTPGCSTDGGVATCPSGMTFATGMQRSGCIPSSASIMSPLPMPTTGCPKDVDCTGMHACSFCIDANAKTPPSCVSMP